MSVFGGTFRGFDDDPVLSAEDLAEAAAAAALALNPTQAAPGFVFPYEEDPDDPYDFGWLPDPFNFDDPDDLGLIPGTGDPPSPPPSPFNVPVIRNATTILRDPENIAQQRLNAYNEEFAGQEIPEDAPFTIFEEPLINIANNQPVGLGAPLRWESHQFRTISP